MTERVVRIRVLDDEKTSREEFKERIRSAFDSAPSDMGVELDVDSWIPDAEARRLLDEREREFREKGHWEMDRGEFELDQVDVFVVDWDLLALEQGEKIAEPWAFHARFFTECKVILMVNRWDGRPNPFDLGLRNDPLERGDNRTCADLDVGAEQLESPLLWWGRSASGVREDEFPLYPWYWLSVWEMLKTWDAVRSEVRNAWLEDPKTTVKGFFEFDEGSWRWLSHDALVYFGQEAEPTLLDALRSHPDFSHKHLKALERHMGNEDWAKVVDSIASPIAASLRRWLLFFVLPEQDVLVDAPHLVTRYTSLMEGHDTLEAWNELTWRRGDGEGGLPLLERLVERLQAHGFPKWHWLQRRVWWWRRVAEDESIPEVRDPWGSFPDPPGVFCEDVARFVPYDSGRRFEAHTKEGEPKVQYVPPYRWLE